MGLRIGEALQLNNQTPMPHPTFHEEEKWHVLLVRPRSEKKVGHRLKELGFKTCVPTQEEYHYWCDRKKKVEIVLFSTYVFVAVVSHRKNDVFFAGNVIKYLSFGGEVAVLNRQEVNMIQQLGQLKAPTCITYERFKHGDEVEICSGSLVGYRGIIDRIQGESKIQLNLPTLHCFANVELKGEDIRLLKDLTST